MLLELEPRTEARPRCHGSASVRTRRQEALCDETAHLYLGYDLVPATLPPDETEFLEIAALPFAEVLDLVLRSEIRDGMTVIAVLHAARLRG